MYVNVCWWNVDPVPEMTIKMKSKEKINMGNTEYRMTREEETE